MFADHRISAYQPLTLPPRLDPLSPTTFFRLLLAITYCTINWRQPSHPQHKQAMFILIRAEQISPSFSPLFVWRIRTKIVDVMWGHHEPFSRYVCFVCSDFFTAVCSRLLEQQPAYIARVIYFFNQQNWLTFILRSYFAVKFCWGTLKLLCIKFCVGDINGVLFSVVFLQYSNCFRFALRLTKSVFHSLHVMAVSFQMPITPYCLLM